jgi:putative endonuclease
MPLARRQALGAFGESAAIGHLQRQGYELLARNWRCSLGEIDLVARQGDQVVFVEVRTRQNDRLGPPEASLSPAKRKRLAALAYQYVAEHDCQDQPWRIDLIAIDVRHGHVSRLEHIRDAIEDLA